MTLLIDRPTVELARELDQKIEFVASLPYDAMEEAEVRLLPAEWRILTADEEQHLFRQMNLAYYSAAQLRDEIQAGADSAEVIDEFRRLMKRGASIRDELVRAFYKLNLAIAAKLTTPVNTFDELVSEGQFTLLRAIVRFDPERGFRFSTYAMHAIQRRMLRFIRQRQRMRELNRPWSDEAAEIETRRWSLTYERRIAKATKFIEPLLQQLSPRERYVIRSRFGWGQEFEPRTLQDIADELGVSRERIRQLEARAMRKLRTAAQGLDVELGAR